ncbi:universal stress protein family, putative [Synechococcus sp. PCC 7335]|nr:universal stress protein family, putative [Synechococcus sp. PCC 7335]
MAKLRNSKPPIHSRIYRITKRITEPVISPFQNNSNSQRGKTMYKTILVALDTDEDCSSVFDQALDLAKSTNATLDLLGVLTPANDDTIPLTAYYPDFGGYPLTVDAETWESCRKRYKAYKENGKAVLMRFAEQAAAVGVQTKVTQAEDTPGRAICDRAKAKAIDLIVVGSHGRKGLSEIFMGSVSNYVMHRAPCSVLVVHTPPNNQKQNTTAEVAESVA